MTNAEITALAERLGATVSRLKYISNRYDFGDDTELFECGVYDMDDAATALRALLAEREVMRGALEMIAGQTPRDQTSKADPGREHYLRTVLISIARQALSTLAPKEPSNGD